MSNIADEVSAINNQLADLIERVELPHKTHQRLVDASNMIYAVELEIRRGVYDESEDALTINGSSEWYESGHGAGDFA